MQHVWEKERHIQGFDGEIRGTETTWKTQAQMEDNINMDLQEMEWEGMDWNDVAENRGMWRAFVRVVMNVWVP